MAEETEAPKHISPVFVYRTLLVAAIFVLVYVGQQYLEAETEWMKAQEDAVKSLQATTVLLLKQLAETKEKLKEVDGVVENNDVLEYKVERLEKDYDKGISELRKHLEEHSKRYWKGISEKKRPMGMRGINLKANPADEDGTVMPVPKPESPPSKPIIAVDK